MVWWSGYRNDFKVYKTLFPFSPPFLSWMFHFIFPLLFVKLHQHHKGMWDTDRQVVSAVSFSENGKDSWDSTCFAPFCRFVSLFISSFFLVLFLSPSSLLMCYVSVSFHSVTSIESRECWGWENPSCCLFPPGFWTFLSSLPVFDSTTNLSPLLHHRQPSSGLRDYHLDCFFTLFCSNSLHFPNSSSWRKSPTFISREKEKSDKWHKSRVSVSFLIFDLKKRVKETHLLLLETNSVSSSNQSD